MSNDYTPDRIKNKQGFSSKPNKQNQKGKKKKIFDIRERTFLFSERMFDIVDMLPKHNMPDIIRKQLIRCGTSIGSNTEEGDGSITKRDFINKISIARKEAKETKYWLRLASGRFIDSKEVEEDIEELEEIIKILSAIIINAKFKVKTKSSND